MGHNALHGCPYCSQKGFKERDTSTQFEPEIVVPLITDESFANRENSEQFQKSHNSPENKGVLEKVNVRMVSQVVPCGMHTCNLGAMKKILKIVFENKDKYKLHKFQKVELQEISDRYELLKSYHPCDFTRVPRSLLENYGHLKATECGYILHYYGMLIFKNIMPANMYKHFLYFSMAARLLSDHSSSPEDLNMAQSLIELFVGNF